jgi:hypothetical protein
MRNFIISLVTLTAFGMVSVSARADEAPGRSATVTGDNATIQEVNMKVDQLGDYNRARMSGTVRNRTSIEGRPSGSVGTVQRGTATTIQTGEGNDGRMDFNIENRTRQRQ